ncbi:MAG: ribulose phosphate epimerase [Nannocystaceae bacterium]
MRSRITTSILSVVLGGVFVAAACNGKDPENETASTTNDAGTDSASSSSGSTSGSTSMGTTDMTTGTDTATGTTTTTTTAGTETGCSFLDCVDQGNGGDNECDIWLQDCPEDEKCMPWANDGGSAWNATKCSMVDANAAPIGDPCMNVGGGVSGVDTCEKGSMCYYVDSETMLGVCVPFCTGSPDSPMCATLDEQCSVSNGGVLILCRKLCNPLSQDCMGAAACLLAAGSDKFVCIVDASGDAGGAGDPCEYLNACDPGLFCANPELVPGCQAGGCCTEFCDLDDPEKDAQCSQNAMGVTCEPFYEPGNEPAGLENVGACVLPAP